MEDMAEGINEMATLVAGLQKCFQVASVMAKEQPAISKENLRIAKEFCRKIEKRVDVFLEEN